METRLDKEGFEKLYGELPFPNKIIVKHPNLGGGLALIWKNEVQLQLVNYTANHILVKVREDDGFEWWLTGFYGWPEACQRYKSWELLAHSRTFVEGPLLCIGDFNAISQTTEKLSKQSSRMNQIDAFHEALENCQLEDLGYRDIHHLPIVLQTKHYGRNVTKARFGFKFEENWLLREDCEMVIKEAWSVDVGGMNGMARLKQKIEVCGEDLRAWGSSRSRPNDEEIKQLQKQLEILNAVENTEVSRSEFLTE
ncbi:hypothetical protein SO802_018127 [Lithocarpus litseifolius]|uniref:Endonuclease/exonuclease/phosphatase domain-containing protein n=1 Tax=Lithocarpus litseifolius TaxID=425828 RepID=A0AAW2CP80_9ROSI